MSCEPSVNAARSRLWRANQKKSVPPDVKALLARGLSEKRELQRQAKAVRELAQIETTAARKIVHIHGVKHPAIRAKLLGDLADWIIERRETLKSAAGIRMFRVQRYRGRKVPAWVPADLVPIYLDPTLNECDAASVCRQMKRDTGR